MVTAISMLGAIAGGITFGRFQPIGNKELPSLWRSA